MGSLSHRGFPEPSPGPLGWIRNRLCYKSGWPGLCSGFLQTSFALGHSHQPVSGVVPEDVGEAPWNVGQP